MLLNSNEISLLVFEPQNFDNIGEITQLTGLIWIEKYIGYGQFTAWTSLSAETEELLKEGNLVHIKGKKSACIIETIKSMVNANGIKTLEISGRTLESIFTNRVIWGTYNVSDKNVSVAIYNLINLSCVNSSDANRNFANLSTNYSKVVGNQVSIQKTGGSIYDFAYELCSNENLSFDVIFKPSEKTMIVECNQSVDRTIEQAENLPIVFDTNLESILTSSYHLSTENYKNVALVAGEDSGSSRKYEVAGNIDLQGFNRKEMYIDARDLQSEIQDLDGNTKTLTPQEYASVLNQRGLDQMSQNIKYETFETQIKTFGVEQYVLGTDYNLGDKVTVVDRELNLIVSAQITEIEETWQNGSGMIYLKFGKEFPTIIQKIKYQI